MGKAGRLKRMRPESTPWHAPFRKGARVCCYLAAHLLVTLVLLAGIEVVRWALVSLHDPKLFDVVPLRYVFDVMDVGLLLTFIIMGTIHGFMVWREE